MVELSIVIPVYNEEKYIRDCLESVVNFESEESFEVFLVDGGSTDNTTKIIKEYQEKYPFVKLLHNPKRIVPVAMNIGIKEATGKYIVRLDAHSKFYKDYIKKLICFHNKLDADNLGGIVITEVKNKTNVSNAIKNVLSDKLGVGSAFRTGVKKIKEVDTVPFGCYRREVFDKIGLYDERLVRNQDIELNKRLKKNGGKIYIVPDIKCIYYARETFKDLAKNNFENGKWNILTAYFTDSLTSLSIRHFVPLIFILSLILPLFLCFIFPKAWYLSLSVLLLYLTVVGLRSYRIKKETTLVKQVLAFLTLHFSYGVGELAGIAKIIGKSFYNKVGKRIFDIVFSMLGILLLSPLFVIVPILIKLDDNGKIFYKQIRIGKHGKPFKLIKFRTMVEHADKIGGTVTKKDDTRITKTGKFLRRTKLDELPQLFNILKGDMSFVGPRPDVPGYADRLTGKDRLILQVRPGITGPATIKYRNEEELLSKVEDPVKYNDEVLWRDKVKINKEYVKNISFMSDLKYILQTIHILKD